ncbi:hypothetical protein ES703_29091 [subsurface metagenome]
MVRILTIGATCCGPNKGAAAMELSAFNVLRELIPDIDFIVAISSIYFEPGIEYCQVHNLRHVDTQEHALKTGLRVARCFLWFILHRYLKLDAKALINEKLLQEYARADLIIDLSGDSISDNYHLLQSIQACFFLLPAIFLGKAVVIYPQSIGPFRTKLAEFVARFTFNRVKFILTREEITKDYLEKVGINKAPVYLAPDISFLLAPAPDEVIKEILLKENIGKNDRPLIGMSVSQEIARFAKTKDGYNGYVKLMAQVVDYLVSRLNAKVILVPEVIGPTKASDDRVIGALVLDEIEHKDRALSITNEYGPEELRGLIGQCDLFIGARMHANIAALSTHVPTIAIAYSYKFHGIMKMLGQENFICDFTSLSFDELTGKIDEAWENRTKIKTDLETRMAVIRDEALLSARLTEDLLKSFKQS